MFKFTHPNLDATIMDDNVMCYKIPPNSHRKYMPSPTADCCQREGEKWRTTQILASTRRICSYSSILFFPTVAIVVIVFACRRITVLCIIFYCHAFSFSGRILIYVYVLAVVFVLNGARSLKSFLFFFYKASRTSCFFFFVVFSSHHLSRRHFFGQPFSHSFGRPYFGSIHTYIHI